MQNLLFFNQKKYGLIIFALLLVNGFVNATTTFAREVNLKTINIRNLSPKNDTRLLMSINKMPFNPLVYNLNVVTFNHIVKPNSSPFKNSNDEDNNPIWLDKILILNNTENEMLTINPNPVKDDLNVKWNFVIEGDKTVSVIDFNGNTVLQFKNIEKNSLSKNLRLLQKGFYVLKLSNQSTNEVIAYRKFIKE